ncbi:hypothetical protein [Vibrio mimicus]|uniref:hypothetical protein n=1 Tax=Vibrio mimicus TaxID=674 RepID=UPI000878973E|nr:hypothetical protein [Vibrio mimicus]AOW84211.1 hypothetical protein VM_15980 [Vibrio mimicus]
MNVEEGKINASQDVSQIDDGSDVSAEFEQLQALAAEITAATESARPISPEEQVQIEEAQRVADINQSASDVFDAQYTEVVKQGVNALWQVAAPNWTLEDAELAPMAQLTKMVIDKHFPNAMENAGPEVMLGMVALTVVSSRLAAGIPPRGKLKGGDDATETES